MADPQAAAELGRTFAGADAVVNLVWGFQPTGDEERLRAVGVGGLAAVLTAAVDARVPRLVHLSSVGAYAPAPPDGAAITENWPTTGVSTSVYSRHKAAAERLLDEHEATGKEPVVVRLRPGLVGQRDAASSLMRYALPGWLPRWALDLVVVLPIDPRLTVPVVHARDVAAALVAAVRGPAVGAFNLAAASPLTARLLAGMFRAFLLPTPFPLLRAVVDRSYRWRLQRIDAGWLDLAYQVPLLDTVRARRDLGWRPTADAAAILAEVLSGMRDGAAGPGAVLRPRAVTTELTDRWSRARSPGGPSPDAVPTS